MRALAPSPAAVRRTSPPFASILCAVDLSSVGAAVAAVAYALASEGGMVHLVHVVAGGGVAPRGPAEAEIAPSTADAIRHAEARLADLVPAEALDRWIASEILVVEATDVAEEISRIAAILGVDVIVAGTHGRSGFGHTLVGSVAFAVAKRSSTPVLLVYPGRPGLGHAALALPPRSILCPTDLSPRSNDAVPFAFALSSASSTVHLLHVWQRPFGSPEDSADERLASELAARRELLAVARAEATRDVTTEVHVVESDDPASTIERFAGSLPADLLILSTHGRGGVRRLLMGAVASDAIRGGAPVILVPSLSSEPG